MKKSITAIALLLLCAVSIIGTAFAEGNLPWSKSKSQVQNLSGLAHTASSSRCDTVARTKGTFKTYSTAGYLGIDATVVDSAGTPVAVKWKVDGKQVWVGPTFKATNSLGSNFSRVSYEGYSAASRSLESCIGRQ